MSHQHFAFAACLGLCLGPIAPNAATQDAPAADVAYRNHRDLSRDLQRLARSHSDWVRLDSIAESLQEREIWHVEFGHGSREERAGRPALLVVAGLDGNDLAGSAVATHWLRTLSAGVKTNDTMRSWLTQVTIHVIPRLNPDPAELWFERPRRESPVNFEPKDDDHDGWKDEDGPDDLNKDGLITWMRVEDPAGEYMIDGTDGRVMIKADPLKGERGQWMLLTEGVDNDQDEAWNEDGLGGVHFDRNFPYQYRYFGADSGLHPISQPPTRALADFMVEHPHVAAVFCFASADNLLKAPKGESNPQRPPTAMHAADADWVKALGSDWRKALGLEKELDGASFPGTFSDWVYYHRGRLALTAKAWSDTLQLRRKTPDPAEKPQPDPDPSAEEKQAEQPEENARKEEKEKTAAEDKDGDKTKPDARGQEEREFLKWIDVHAPEAFVKWEPYEHPDFPGQRVEIGGWAPFARSNPPESVLGDWARREGDFLTALAQKLPRVEVRRAEIKPLGKGVYDIRLEIENAGYLPTSLAQGETTNEVFPTRVELKVPEEAVLAGDKRTMLGTMAGQGGMREVRWICYLPQTQEVEVEIVSMLGGAFIWSTNLPEEP